MRHSAFKYILVLWIFLAFDSVCLAMSERVVLSNRMSFAQQVKDPNTIYEIKYDFDLKGQSVNLPESAILYINGGSLKNGLIVGNKSLISYGGGSMSVELKGTFRNDSFDITWFGAQMSSGKELFDNTAVLNLALKSSGNTGVPLSVPSGIFYHDGLVMPESSAIIGSSINGSVLRLLPSSRNSNITIVSKNCQVSDITLWGNDKNQRFDLSYEEHEGNGITICNGSRIGYGTSECTNTKIFNLIIKNCGNCGLALLDKHKWVYSFYNVTISRCGNIGFLDKSSDNNYQGFNISHCENAGMVVKGGRNRYTTFKVFVCGYNYREEKDNGRPQGIYWQGVRVEGIHNILSSFDIQECGAELLYLGKNARGNHVTATLDRPGFGSRYVSDFRSYDIQGYGNILDLISLEVASYNELPGRALNSNMVLLAQDNSSGCTISPMTHPYPVKSNYLEPLLCSFSTSTGSAIKESNKDKYISFSGKNATLKKTLDVNVDLDNMEELAVTVSFRLFLGKGESCTFYYLFDSPYSAVSIKILRDESGFYSELRNGSVSVSKSAQPSGNNYVDVYVNKNGGEITCMLKDESSVVINRINSPDEPFISSKLLKSIRISSGTIMSDLHIARGQVSDPIDIKSVFGMYFPMNNNLVSRLSNVKSDSSRPVVSVKGFMFFDENIGKPIWWDGNKWIDANGKSI